MAVNSIGTRETRVWSDRDIGEYAIRIDFDIFTEAILDRGIESLLRNPTTKEKLKYLHVAYIIPCDNKRNDYKIISGWGDVANGEITVRLESTPRRLTELESLFPTFRIADFDIYRKDVKPEQILVFPEEGSLEPQEEVALIKMTMEDIWKLALQYDEGRKTHR